jgi:cell shape-determining protein MreC
MLIRVCLIAAIVFGLAISAVNLVQVRQVITTTRDTLNTTSNTLVTTQSELSDTKQELEKTSNDLKSTQQTLETTKNERDRLRGENDSLSKQTRTLQQNLQKTSQERDAAQAEVAAWKALGIPVDQVKVIIATARRLQEDLDIAREENKVLSKERERLQNKLNTILIEDYKVPLPLGLKGVVLVADPKWDFVVLDVGEDHGVLEDGELLVNRDGRLVAKVRVRSVQKDRSIANVVPGWKLGDVMEGDQVIPSI